MEQNEMKPTMDRMKMQELALVGLIKAGKAHIHHALVPVLGGEKGEIKKEPHVFYKLDCPNPNLRKDGSIWPNPPGVISVRKNRDDRPRLIPQEEIH